MFKINKLIFSLIMILGAFNYLFAQDLLLWNKLGSDAEIRNSQVGSNGTVFGSVYYSPLSQGIGAHIKDHSNANIKFPSGCYNKTNGCIECWVNMGVFSSYPSFDGVIFETYNSPNSVFISLTILPYKICLTYSSANYTIRAKAIVEDISWRPSDVFHLCIVYDINHTYDGDKTLSLYINGVEKAYSTSSIDKLTDGDLYLCKNPYANIEYFPGSISSLRIWNYPKITFSNLMY